jgi:hypothetical protein
MISTKSKDYSHIMPLYHSNIRNTPLHVHGYWITPSVPIEKCYPKIVISISISSLLFFESTFLRAKVELKVIINVGLEYK